MQWLIDFLRPPENNPKALRRWYFNVSLSLMAFWGLILTASLTPLRPAFPKDVDQKVNAAKAELAKQINDVANTQREQGQKLDSQTRLLAESLAENVAGRIRLNISKRCKTNGYVERDEISREIERLQDEYRVYKGDFYRQPTCTDL